MLLVQATISPALDSYSDRTDQIEDRLGVFTTAPESLLDLPHQPL